MLYQNICYNQKSEIMSTRLSKENVQLSDMYLNIIIDATLNLSSGNIAHKAAAIKRHAEALKKIIQEAKLEESLDIQVQN